MKSVEATLVISLLVGAVAAQKSAYEQCGGMGYPGSSNCVAVYSCTLWNPYYYHCYPGTSTSSTKTTSTQVSLSTTFSKTNGLLFNIDGFNDVNTIPLSSTVYYQYPSASGSEINTGANGLQKLDYVVNTAAQTQYRACVKAVVSRYTTSPAVFAWELANEPRCSGCGTSVIYNWAASTSQYIKSFDSNQCYPYQPSAGGYIWQDTLNMTTLDFATFHLYPDSCEFSICGQFAHRLTSSRGQPYDWGNLWVTSHGAACAAENKPCLFEECNNNCTVENPWQKTALATKGIAGDRFWQYGEALPSCNCQTSQDGNTVFCKQDNWGCMVTSHVADINSAYP
ncbi:glycoside hydrolase family 5 protein [Coniochaeta sp. 2T2.1]|nr:glycoside hydrolase family 5 protein [Coniochaeta sp. 2T2.1]